MLTGAPLDSAILKLPSRPRRDTYFRATRLIFASDPLGKQRPIVAQRFNFAAGARVLYLADDQVTALNEAQAFGFPASSIAIIPVQFDLRAVVDLRDPAVHKLLRTDAVELSLSTFDLHPLALRHPPSCSASASQPASESTAFSTIHRRAQDMSTLPLSKQR